jgi:hypothetical protein
LGSDDNQYGIAFDFTWGYDHAKLNVDCSSCTSPELPELIAELYRSGESGYDKIDEMVRRLVDSDGSTSFLTTLLDGSASRCPHSPEYDPEAAIVPGFAEAIAKPEEDLEEIRRDRTSMFMNLGFISFCVGVVLAYAVMRIIVRNKNKKWRESLSSEGAELLEYVDDKEREREEYMDQTMPSLYRSRSIPVHVRVLVPIVLVTNIVLFIVAHSAISIVLGVDVDLAGDDFYVSRMFEFNFADGLRNTYKKGGYEMAILLLIFGGIWPYFRCLLSLVIWFAPPQMLSSAFRGRLLLWFDAMNKLTVRDITKFLIIIAILFIYAGGPYVFNKGDGDLYSARIIGVPGPAIYCGITAMAISRFSSTWILDHHHTAIEAAQKAYHHQQHTLVEKEGETDGNTTVTGGTFLGSETSGDGHWQDNDQGFKESGIPMEITIDGRRYISLCGKRIQYGTFGFYVGVFSIVLVLLVGLIFIPAVSIDLTSIMELFLESGTTYEEAISTFGVYAFVCAVLLKARLALESRLDYVAVFCLFVVGIAASCVAGFLGMMRYIREIRGKGWKGVYTLFFPEQDDLQKEIPAYLRQYAFRNFSVYFFSYAIGIFQLGAVTTYAIHYFCSSLDSIYEFLAFVGLLPATDGQCWEAQISQRHNIIVFFGCFFYLTFAFAMQLNAQYKWNLLKASQLVQKLDEQQERSVLVERASDAWKESSLNKKSLGSRIRGAFNIFRMNGGQNSSKDVRDKEEEGEEKENTKRISDRSGIVIEQTISTGRTSGSSALSSMSVSLDEDDDDNEDDHQGMTFDINMVIEEDSEALMVEESSSSSTTSSPDDPSYCEVSV